ncbi:hypothetical protein DES54_13417 [Brenneria salicis ATCC 15712 = DSM 30166]|uniref:Uncharacterized protein n=1 Tax=Brenneria salicis ATCC 15712 = DSM 30166 TaxID=714314 RepID=A0A366I0C8_9GAMM|nr:hypothetical protein DES54_13417 [Brenneria salicis ATCC 15712 = DSM 30166]
MVVVKQKINRCYLANLRCPPQPAPSIALSASNFQKLPRALQGGSLDAGIDFTKVYC